MYNQTYENDMILAKFLGGILVSESTLNPMIKKWDSVNKERGANFKPLHGRFMSGHGQEFKFTYSFNWLMAVVEKIESLKMKNKKSTCDGVDTFKVLIHTDYVEIIHYGDFTIQLLEVKVSGTKMEAIYEACVRFIKWYNENRL